MPSRTGLTSSDQILGVNRMLGPRVAGTTDTTCRCSGDGYHRVSRSESRSTAIAPTWSNPIVLVSLLPQSHRRWIVVVRVFSLTMVSTEGLVARIEIAPPTSSSAAMMPSSSGTTST